MAPVLPSSKPLAFRGCLVHTPKYGQMDMLLDRVVIVIDGKIAKIAAGSEEATVLSIYDVPANEVKRLAEGQFLMPGLIDTHVHAPQVRWRAARVQ
jgi:guanine deaminase